MSLFFVQSLRRGIVSPLFFFFLSFCKFSPRPEYLFVKKGVPCVVYMTHILEAGDFSSLLFFVSEFVWVLVVHCKDND